MSSDMSPVVAAADRYADLIGERVTVTFSDRLTETGRLTGAGWDTIEVLHTYGEGHQYTAQYTLTGDEDTPHVVNVAPADAVAGAAQDETLF